MYFNTISKLIRYKMSSIKENRWFFTSLNGDYSDNPKAISEYLHELHPEVEIVWGVRQDVVDELPNYVKTVERGSEEEFVLKGSSKIIIENGLTNNAFNLRGSFSRESIRKRILLWFFEKKGQHVYSSWHGTPLKCLDRDQIGNEDISGFACNPFTMFVGNSFTKGIMEHVTFEKIKVMSIGMPRNDILFNKADVEKIKKRLQIPRDKKVVLFAPTFRNDGKDVEGKNIRRSGLDQIDLINFKRLFNSLNIRFGSDWVFVCRFHYHVSELVNWKELENQYGNRIINGNKYNDMATYLSVTDILITDASSCMFDFSLTLKPCFLFFPDYEHYINKERGLYKNISDLPFPLALNFDELISQIENFDENTYLADLQRMNTDLGNVDDGLATKRVVHHIWGELENESAV